MVKFPALCLSLLERRVAAFLARGSELGTHGFPLWGLGLRQR
jgi:hypothetical protein